MRSIRSLCLVLAVVGCGDHHAATPDAPGQSPDAPAPDAGGPFMEAPHPSQPVVMNAGGSVLASPKVVPVFFSGDDTVKSTIEDFLTQMAASSYWPAISSEYGIGALTIAPTVVATEAPPTTDTALQQLITAHAGGTGGWPASDANTIYAVFLPAGVVLSSGGAQSCVAFGGYHDETQTGVIYALMPRCMSMSFPGLAAVTIATSHEILEASTDPHPQSNPAYVSIDDDDAIWQLTPGAELGDMCEYSHATYQPLIGSYYVQRTWSAASAASGHDPCVPLLSTPYVEAATNLQDITINVPGGGGSLTTRGIAVPLGMSKTVEVDLYSDAPAPDWTVQAIDVASKYQMSSAELMLTLDKSMGHNGDKLQLTITRLKNSQFGVSELGLSSQVGGTSVGTWWALVSQ